MTVHSTRGVLSESHLPFAGLHRLLAEVLPFLNELGVSQQKHLRAAFGLEEGAFADPFQIALSALQLLTSAARTDHCLSSPMTPSSWIRRPSTC